jgi:hypothetical protein
MLFYINIISHTGSYITSLVCTALHIVLRIFVTMAWFWSLSPKYVVIFLNKSNMVVPDENLTI